MKPQWVQHTEVNELEWSINVRRLKLIVKKCITHDRPSLPHSRALQWQCERWACRWPDVHFWLLKLQSLHPKSFFSFNMFGQYIWYHFVLPLLQSFVIPRSIPKGEGGSAYHHLATMDIRWQSWSLHVLPRVKLCRSLAYASVMINKNIFNTLKRKFAHTKTVCSGSTDSVGQLCSR